MDKPVIIVSTISSEYSVSISWIATGIIDGFYITRSTGSGSPITIVTLSNAYSSYTDYGVSPATTYIYTVYAFNKCGESSNYNKVVTVCPQTESVFGLTVTAISPTRIDIDWLSFWTGYTFTVRRSTDNISYSTIASGLTVSNYTDTVAPGSCYYYKVIATACGVDSAAITTSLTCSPCSAPSAPHNLIATAISPTKIDITWNASTGIVSTYTVQKFVGGVWVTLSVVSSSIFSYSDESLIPSTQYCYKVIATNSCGTAGEITCDTTYDAALCESAEETFNWDLFDIEPGLYPIHGTPPSGFTDTGTYINYSPVGIIDITNPLITGVGFGQYSGLDDILVLMKPNETIDLTYPAGSSSNGRGHISCILPNNCILFLDTLGYYVNGEAYDRRGNQIVRFSVQKDFTEAGTTHHHTVVVGKPPGTPHTNRTGHASDFIASGFTVVPFNNGIALSTLQDKGFIVTDTVTGNRFFEFKFAHIPCGYGFVNIDHLTCVTATTSSSSSTCVVLTPPVFSPTDALCCLTIDELNVETIPALSALNINLSGSGGTIADGAVELNWTNISGNYGYIVERSVSGGGVWIVIYILLPNITVFFDYGLDLSIEYCYRVTTRGCNSDFDSDPSDPICTSEMTSI